jgi:hypothetical protein
MKNLLLAVCSFLFLGTLSAQMEEGSIYGTAHFSIQIEDLNSTNEIEWSISPQVGYYVKNKWAVGLIGHIGFQHFESYSQNTAVGTETGNSKEGQWGGFGPITRLHIGSEKASLFGEFSFQYGWFNQRSETTATENNDQYYLQKGTYQQLTFGPGFAYYFTPRIGAEFVTLFNWYNVQRKSGNVLSDDEVENFNQQTLNFGALQWKIGIVAFVGKGKSKAAQSE